MGFLKILTVLVGIGLALFLGYRSCPTETDEEATERPKKIQKEEKKKILNSEEPALAEPETTPSEQEESQPPETPLGSPVPLAKGFEHLQKGELAEAEEYFSEHVKLYPIDPEGHFGLGVVYRTEEFFDQSVEEFAKTLLLNPGHLQAKYQVAEMLTFQMQQDYETAELLYEEILEVVPEEKAALNGLASVYLSTGRTDQAIETWERLREELPDQPGLTKNLGEAYFAKANALLDAGDSEQARDWLAKAREMNPEDPAYEAKWQEILE